MLLLEAAAADVFCADVFAAAAVTAVFVCDALGAAAFLAFFLAGGGAAGACALDGLADDAAEAETVDFDGGVCVAPPVSRFFMLPPDISVGVKNACAVVRVCVGVCVWGGGGHSQ